MVADLVAVLYEARWKRWKNSMFCQISIGGEEGVLVKPQTYMNLSGLAVKLWWDRGDWDEDDLLVVHDEVDLPFGVLRLKRGGGTAGHNGLKSIVKEMGFSDFCRLRVGVGRPEESYNDLAHYLLSPLTPEEMDAFVPVVRNGAEAVKLWWTEGIERAMNMVNKREKDEERR